jgi:hypothetical protein
MQSDSYDKSKADEEAKIYLMKCGKFGCKTCARGSAIEDESPDGDIIIACPDHHIITGIDDAQMMSKAQAPPWLFPLDAGLCRDAKVPVGDATECAVDNAAVTVWVRRTCLGQDTCMLTSSRRGYSTLSPRKSRYRESWRR